MNKFEYQGQALKELRNKANYTMLEVAERRGKRNHGFQKSKMVEKCIL